jgi:hypothetical protein
MKKNSIFFFGVLLFIQFLLVGGVWGQSAGFNNTFIVLSLNGGANTYYDLNATTTNQDFNGANLGSFAPGSSNLTLKGAEHNVYKCGSSNLSSTRLNYRIYLTASPSGAYTSQDIGYSSNTGNGCGGQDQVWSNTGLTINLLSGLSAGAYTIEVYSDATVTNCCGGTVYASNSSNNYKATFTIIGDFYSKSTGNLETLSNWGSNTDGTGTAPANFTSNGVTFNIRNNATPSIGASWTVSGTGSKIVVGDGTNACNFTVPSTFIVTSPTTNVSNNGTITRTSSAAQSFGTLNVLAGGTYDHNYATGSLPTATWNASSTLFVSATLQNNNFSGVTFGNVTFRNAAGTTMLSASAHQITTIAGNLNLEGTGTIIMSTQPTGWTATVTVNGNVNISGNSTFRIESVGTVSGSNTKTLLVLGDYIQSNGTMDLATNTSGTISARTMILEVLGNFTHTGGTITENASDDDMITRVLLSKTTGTQTLESTGQTGSINFNVAGSNAQCVISATKTFTLSSGSSMTIGAGTSNPDFSISGSFLNQSSVSLTVTSATIGVQSGGNYICNHGTGAGIATPLGITTFNSGSTMTYRGSSALTPNLSLSGRTYHHLTIESTSGALSLSGTGVSSLVINGDLTIGANCTFNPNVTTTPTPGHSIKGNISIGSGGTLNYNPLSAGTLNLNGSTTQTISGAGTFTTGANATLAVGASSTIDFGATNAIAGFGTFTTASGSSLITANTSGINGSLTLTNKSLNAATNYTFNGSSAQVTGASVTSANNLIQNNSAGLTLDSPVTVSNNLTMTAGNITTTPTNILSLGNSAPASLTWTSGKVVGPMKRWMAAATNSGASSSMFPLGSPTRNAQASIEYTTAPTTAGYLEAKFVASNPTSVVPYPSPLTDQFNYVLNNVVSEGYWEIKPSATSGVDGGAYTVTLEGETISLAASTNASYTDVRVIKSPVPHSSWVLQGAHGTATGANADFTVSRTGMSGYSFFAMAFPSSAPLPVELVSFAANCDDNNTVSVNWTTASEHNSDYYTVEKSRDGIAWNVLKTIPAAGNSTQLINYSVADASDISGTVYYRLTQVDIDGASKVYDIVSTSCSSEKELALIAYPNPSNGQFTVKIENALGGKYALTITDMQGKAIEEQSLDLETGTTLVKLNPVGLQPGVYLLQFMQDGNMLQQQKLIIE